MSETAIAKAGSLQTYSSLRSAVRKAIALGKERAVRAVEREKVRASWDVGKLIVEHILLNKDRAEYGEAVIARLGQDIGVSDRELRYMVEFGRAYPIRPPAAELSWAHYRDLLGINAGDKRQALAHLAAQNDWTRERLRAEIKKKKAGAGSAPKALVTRAPARPGKPGTYGVVAIKGRRYYDLGFSTYYPVQGKAGRGKKGGPAEEDLYTYHAEVTRVVDGDSFYAHIALGFGIVLEARLRLRALNADELPTRAGIRAKKALEGLLTGRRKQVLIKTAKSDQYGRYLADVWVGGKDITTELLQAGLTLR